MESPHKRFGNDISNVPAPTVESLDRIRQFVFVILTFGLCPGTNLDFYSVSRQKRLAAIKQANQSRTRGRSHPLILPPYPAVHAGDEGTVDDF